MNEKPLTVSTERTTDESVPTMSSYDAQFWDELDRYHDLAERYERHVEITHPDYVTSDSITATVEHWSSWCATDVIYYEYRGPRV